MTITQGSLVRAKCANSPEMVVGEFGTSSGAPKYAGRYECFWYSVKEEEFRSEWFYPEMLEEIEVTEQDNGMGGVIRKVRVIKPPSGK